MLLINCPYCGPRAEIEFSYAGQAHIVRPPLPSDLGDDAWCAFLYLRDNPKGLHRERWRHLHGCARYFNVARDTRDDRIVATYEIGHSMPEEDAQ